MPLRQLIPNNCTISLNTKQIDFGRSVTISEKHTHKQTHTEGTWNTKWNTDLCGFIPLLTFCVSLYWESAYVHWKVNIFDVWLHGLVVDSSRLRSCLSTEKNNNFSTASLWAGFSKSRQTASLLKLYRVHPVQLGLYMLLECGRKLENPEEIHTWGEHEKSTRKRTQARSQTQKW